MDKIYIKNLEIFARHGVFPEERALGQKFVISAELHFDSRDVGKSDEFEDALDYGKICQIIKDFVEKKAYRLIEAVAENLSEKLLIEIPVLQKVRLEIKKPWAPVHMHLETVSIEIERGRHMAYIGLGSNIGNREGYLRFAAGELEKARGCRIVKASSLIDTEPYGYLEQGVFLNGCLALETLFRPHELLELLHEIEDKAGRTRCERWGPRTLDLDIIFYDDIIMSCDTLRIPHPEVQKREFVLAPLSEIAPNLLHPLLNKTVSEMLKELRNGNSGNS